MDCIVHGVTKSWTQLSDFHNLTTSRETIVCVHEFYYKELAHVAMEGEKFCSHQARGSGGYHAINSSLGAGEDDYFGSNS